jgi:hypothetical protein
MKRFIKTTVSVGLLSIIGLVAACTSKPTAEREPSSTFGRAKLGEAYFFDPSTIYQTEVKMRRYDLNNPADLSLIEQSALEFLKEYKRLKDSNEKQKDQYVVSRESKEPFNKFDFTDGNLKDSAQYLVELFNRGRSGEATTEEVKYQIAQVGRAVELQYAEPIKGKYEFFFFPVYIARFLSSPSVSEDYKGQDPDVKFFRDEVVQEKDSSKIDFGSDFKFKEITSSCQYEKAKRGFGVHAGFHIKCGDTSYKMKFGNEEYSGPFNSRIYRSLGYLTPHINFYETLTIDYDRRILTEFNDRSIMKFKVSFAGIPVINKGNKKFINPFNYVKGVNLKDGSFVEAKDVVSRLITKPLESVEDTITADMIDLNFESQIAQVVFNSSTLTLKNDPVTGDELGPWIPDDFNYRDFKEIRGIMVLAAWTGNYDIRKDNLRLMAVPDSNGKKQLRLTFGDAGSGLGHATGIKRNGSIVDAMEWEVSSVYQSPSSTDRNSHGPEEQRISLSGIGNLEHAKAFSRIKITDAQWMLNKLCKFTPEQIKTALVSSGLSSAEVMLAKAKLLERRNKMLVDFKATPALKASCTAPVNRKFNYDPAKDNLVTIKLDNNSKVFAAPDRGHKVVEGRLIGFVERH